MRLRQFVFVAEDLKSAVVDIGATLGLAVCYNDPNVGAFGLHNALLPIGGDLIEVVAPIQDGTTAGRYLERRQGNGGYMLILECGDALVERERIIALGIRDIWRHDADDCHATHFHPADVPGAILSIDDMGPEGDPAQEMSRWKWAGPNWQAFVQTQNTKALVAVEIQADDPDAVAERWAAVLDCPMEQINGKPAVKLDNAHIRFVPDKDGRGTGISAIDILPADRGNILAMADKRGLRQSNDQLMLCGVRVNLV
ncbi:MAG: VOC family protein [Proteobacteria bacterium]|nr:VOC family protein [Pseudomonadota bacterium]